VSRGVFISFEGGEGCGKSTHIRLLAERLRAGGLEVVTTREPGGTPLCEAIRGLLQFDAGGESPCPAAETLLFCASRAQLVANVIRPALERGAWVLSDRFYDSTYAYQGYGRGYAVAGVRPDLTFLLDAGEAAGHERLAARIAAGTQADRFEREKEDFHRRVRNGFRALAEAEPERWRIIDSSLPTNEVSSRIWEIAAQMSLRDR
jgi:dTMP kinase